MELMEPPSSRSAMRNGAQRSFPSIRQSTRKSRSSVQCQIESYDLDSSKARIRDLLVSIADKKTELEDINSQLEEADLKQQQLTTYDHGRRSSRFMGRPPYHINDGNLYVRHSSFSTMDSLPDQFFPAFEFDGESEGIFKRSRHRGWSIVERQMYSVTKASRSSSSWTHDRPQLTHRSSSSFSYMTDGYSSELDDIILQDFPAPPERASKTWHNRDYSAMSGATLLSTSTAQDEISAVLEAKSLFLQRKTSRGPILVQISPTSELSQGLRISTHKRQSLEPRSRYRYSNASPSRGRSRLSQTSYGLANGFTPYTIKPMSSVIESPLLGVPSGDDNQPKSPIASPNSSHYSQDVDGRTQTKESQPEVFNSQRQAIDNKVRPAPGPPKRIPPRTSSLYPNSPNIQTPKLGAFGDAPRSSSVYPDSAYIRTPKLRPFGDEIDPATGLRMTSVDLVPLKPQHSLIARSTLPQHSTEIQALSTARTSSQARRRNCFRRLCDRSFTKQAPKRRSGIQRLRARIRSLPLNPSWWKDRHSGPARFPPSSGRMSQIGHIRSTASSPLPNLQRASSSLRIERAFTAMVHSSNASSNNSVMLSPNRTIRAIHRASYISVTESSRPSTPGTPPYMFTNIDRDLGNISRVSDRYHGRIHMASNTLDVPLNQPNARVVQGFLERPATHRRIPSLAELA